MSAHGGATVTFGPASHDGAVSRHAVRVELTADLHIAGTLVTSAGSDPVPAVLLVCAPGGTYTQDYFDMRAPDSAGASFAAYAVTGDVSVLVLDTLGTGSSSHPDDGDSVTLDCAAQALITAAELVAGAVGARRLVGCGHSLGARLVTAAQCSTRIWSAIALLGYRPTWRSIGSDSRVPPGMSSVDLVEWVRDRLAEQDPDLWADSYVTFDRPRSRSPFDAVLSTVPRGMAIEFGIPEIAIAEAAAIDVPVFLAYGEYESVDVEGEAACFGDAADVSMFVQRGAGHCHHEAATRTDLWDSLLKWISTLPDGERCSHER